MSWRSPWRRLLHGRDEVLPEGIPADLGRVVLIPLTKTESRDLLEIVEARYERSSTIFCSQFAPPGWHERIAEDALADAVLDRIENSSYKILIDGDDSMRKRKGFQSE